MCIFDESWKKFIEENASLLGMGIHRAQTDRFAVHAEELIRWNRKINLTAITDSKEIAIKHFLDSVVPARFIEENITLLDIGAGGGYPGIVLKVLIPSLNVTLIDASLKKVNFLKHVVRTLKLSKIRVLHIRAEELAQQKESFQIVISRALTDLQRFIDMAEPLLAPAGMIIAMTGPGTGADHAYQPHEASGHFETMVHSYTLPEILHPRNLHVFRKIA